MGRSGALPAVGPKLDVERPAQERAALDVAAVYEQHFDFVWRTARRLGVRGAQIDDVVQEVFVIVHRSAAGFEGRSKLRTWLFAITRRVARDHFRSARRKPVELVGSEDPSDVTGRDPEAQVQALQGHRLLHALLDALDADKREVFVMVELEQMSMPEIAETLEINLNTAYARLRAARAAFEQALARHRARQRSTP
jgi:RNA polymerase sigma-70 factor (ECF subfamily)